MAAELFPLVLDEAKEDIWIGVFSGFIVAFFFLNGFETLIEASSELSKNVNINGILLSIDGASNVLNLIAGEKKKCGGAGNCGCHDCGGHAHSHEVVNNPMMQGQESQQGKKKNNELTNLHEGDSLRLTHRSSHGMYGSLEMVADEENNEGSGHDAVYSPLGAPNDTTSLPPPPAGGSPVSPETARKGKTKVVCDDCTNVMEASSHGSDIGVLESDALEAALEAINDPDHKDRLQNNLLDMTKVIGEMELKSKRFIEESLTTVETERLAEEVDESIHQLQYQLDHCRRLLHGSEAKSRQQKSEMVTSWLTEEKKIAMNDRLKLLRLTAVHLVGHIRDDNINEELIHEMLQHMKEMDRHINHFHDAMDIFTTKWRSIPLPNVEFGATLPMSLVVPVTLDCFVDGFLIGVSVALSPKAGYVLAGANCLEMGSLGMAYSARIAKCTGSSFLNRQLAVYLPPILMLLSAGFGALLAGHAHAVPSVFVGFVAFGIYALVALVCGELIIEAKEAHADDEKWWVTACLFFGIFTVLMLHPVL